MSTPAPSGGLSPLRVGGLALLGVGVVAGLIGLGTLATSNGGQSTAAPTSSASATTDPGALPGPTEVAPTTTPDGVAVPSFGPTSTNGIAAPPTTAPGVADGSGGAGTAGTGTGGSGTTGSDGSGGAGTAGSAGGPGSVAAVRAPLRVYNNSTITGLADDAAADFRSAGWSVETVGNYPQGIIPTSTVYYRPGTGEESAAKVLGDEFGMRVNPRFDGLEPATPGLIVIVTRDYQKRG